MIKVTRSTALKHFLVANYKIFLGKEAYNPQNS